MKVGLVPGAAWYRELGRRLPFSGVKWLVLDPVLRPTRGIAVHDRRTIRALRRWVLPRVDLLTPNAEEAARLLERSLARVEGDPEDAARRLLELGPRAVLLKGGHFRKSGTSGAFVVDRLRGAFGERDLRSRRIGGTAPRGTGCALSAAVVALLARGRTPAEAVVAAHDLVRGGIRSRVHLGRGRPYLGLLRED
jgi:hydroxymethylpyrimidine/phosphomethylpyrimidine kinase